MNLATLILFLIFLPFSHSPSCISLFHWHLTLRLSPFFTDTYVGLTFCWHLRSILHLPFYWHLRWSYLTYVLYLRFAFVLKSANKINHPPQSSPKQKYRIFASIIYYILFVEKLLVKYSVQTLPFYRLKVHSIMPNDF